MNQQVALSPDDARDKIRSGTNGDNNAEKQEEREEEESLSEKKFDFSTSGGCIVKDMMEMLFSEVPDLQLTAAQILRKLLCKGVAHKILKQNPPMEEVINSAGVLEKLVQFLMTVHSSKLQFEAAWSLTNIAAGPSTLTTRVVEAGAVPLLIQLLCSTHEDVKEMAVWALGNIAGDGPVCRDYVINCNVLSPLLILMANLNIPLLTRLLSPSTNLPMTKKAVWALSNLFRGRNPPPVFEKVSPSLSVLSKLLHSSDIDLLVNVCWGLAYLLDGPADQIQVVLNSGVCPRLVALLVHREKVAYPALRAVGNILTGSHVQTQEMVLNCSALPSLRNLLLRRSMVREVCWALSNITAGHRTQLQLVIDAKIFPILIEIWQKSTLRIQIEAGWAIVNAVCGATSAQMRYLVEVGCIEVLCELLVMKDLMIVLDSLRALEYALMCGDRAAQTNCTSENPFSGPIEAAKGLDRIMTLQYHESSQIYQKAVDIIDNFFSGKEDENCNRPPQVEQALKSF